MAETIQDMRAWPRREAYTELSVQTRALLDGIDDRVAAMATISSLIHSALGYLWTGFYQVAVPDELLRVGPYQGSIGCLEITFGKGVCGTAAAERRTVIVDDVSTFEGHITCDPRSRSEIVVPVFDPLRELIAVFDVDSAERAAFTDEDRKGMEQILSWFQNAGGR